jgi:hypothetical protein
MKPTYIVHTLNSVYVVDTDNKIISGGAYGDREVPYGLLRLVPTINIDASIMIVEAMDPKDNLRSSRIRSVEFAPNVLSEV